MDDPGVDIAAAVAAVRAEIAAACARAGRDPAGVRLIAVTKAQGPEVLGPLLAAGVTEVGENRLEHHEAMRAAAPAGLRFHAIGRLQGRQLPKLLPLSHAIHGLAQADHLQRLDRACAEQGRRIEVFLQVNTSGEAAKAGVPPADLAGLVAVARGCRNLDLVGLMTMAPELGSHADEAQVRSAFGRLRQLAGEHGLPRLSMGMSGDFPIAVEEGATEVRIGTRLFVGREGAV